MTNQSPLVPSVVALTPRQELDRYDFCIDRTRGVCAFAYADGGGTSLFDFGGFASHLVIEKIANNFSDRRDGVDLSVLKHEATSQDPYSPARLLASIKAANHQLVEQGGDRFRERMLQMEREGPAGSASVTAMMAVDDRIITMQAGTQAQIYRVRQGQRVRLSPPTDWFVTLTGGSEFGLPPASLGSLGYDAPFEVLVQEEQPRSGDVYVLASSNTEQLSPMLDILAQEPFEHALAACFAIVDCEPLVIARWAQR